LVENLKIKDFELCLFEKLCFPWCLGTPNNNMSGKQLTNYLL